MASMVSIASRRVSSWPVAMGKVRLSTMMSDSRMPQLPVRSSISRVATDDLPVGGAGLALFVDGERDDRGAVLADQRHHLGDAGVRAVAVLVVDRVDHRAATEQLQAGLDDRRFGRVQHQRQGGRGGEPADDLPHVGHAVPADVVHAHVEQVRAVAGLGPGDLHALVPLLGRHGFAERLGAVGVGPLADGQERGVLLERHVRVERGHAGLGPRPARQVSSRPPTRSTTAAMCSGVVPQQPPTSDRPNSLVNRSCASASWVGGERIVGAVGGQLGQARVGHAGQRHPGVRGQVAQVLAHLRGTGGAVEPDGVDARAAPARSARRRSRCRAAWCRWSRS